MVTEEKTVADTESYPMGEGKLFTIIEEDQEGVKLGLHTANEVEKSDQHTANEVEKYQGDQAVVEAANEVPTSPEHILPDRFSPINSLEFLEYLSQEEDHWYGAVPGIGLLSPSQAAAQRRVRSKEHQTDNLISISSG